MYKIYTRKTYYLFGRPYMMGSPVKALRLPDTHPVLKKMVMRMNFTVLLLAISMIQVSAESFGQRLTYSAENVTLKSIFREITRQTGYDIVYAVDNLNEKKKISVTFNHTPLEEALEVCLKGFPVTYIIQDKTILIKRWEQFPDAKKGNTLMTETPNKQLTVRGKISDASGEPLPGVSIVVKGSTVGASSDIYGNYELASVPEDAMLVFSFLGYKTLEEAVNGRELINVMLEQDIAGLEEVVVVGYGTQKKTSLTSAVSSMAGVEIASVPTTNLSNNIGGRLPGVIVKQTSGEPGRDGSAIFIRGIATTGATAPLLVVDGIPRSFQQLDPNSIESFTVLKDAAAVAPYGVAGANGVILVTTKRGETGKPTLSYNGYVGFQNPTVLPDLVNGYQFAVLKNTIAENEGLPKPYSDAALKAFRDGTDPDAFPPYKDPWGEITKQNTLIHYHNIEVTGGSENIKYYAGLGYQFQDGMWAVTKADRFNLTMNLDARMSATTRLLLNLNGTVKSSQYPPSDQPNRGTGRIMELIKYAHPQNGPLFYSNGLYTYASAAILGSGEEGHKSTGIFSQLTLEQDIPFIPGLAFKGTIAYDPSFYKRKTWATPLHVATVDTTQQPYVITDGLFGPPKPSLDQSWSEAQQFTYQASLDYQREFGDHHVDLIGVFEAKANTAESLGAYRRNYNLYIDEISMGSSDNEDMNTAGTSSMARQVGLVYRAAYNYKEKYLLEASGRYDGHYYFAPENRFGFFPAFSVGWRISEENFLKDRISWLDNLKIRASYGEVGALAGGPFQYLGAYGVVGPGYVIDGSAVQMITERAEPNPDITWERAKKTDVGLELSLWGGLLNLEADYFYEKRSNMLIAPDVLTPVEYGIGLSQVNAGIMENRGVDLTLGLQYSPSADWHFALNGAFTYARNKVLQTFETDVTYNNPNRRRTGRPLNTQFGYGSVGYFQPDDFNADGSLKPGIATQPWGAVQPGDIRYRDANSDGKIDVNDEVVIGDPAIPAVVYGISPSISYKNFSLDMLFQGAGKVSFIYAKEAIWPFWNGQTAFVDNFDYWTPENPDARHPRLTAAPTSNNTQASSHWMQDVSYLRLKNATLSYTLPAVLLERAGIGAAQIYASGQNILTWTDLINIDPEISNYKANAYPQQKVISLGLRLTL